MIYFYIGRFFPPTLLETIKEDCYNNLGFSNHNFEKSLLTGLSSHLGKSLEILTIPNVGSFPNNCRKRKIEAETFQIGHSKACSMGFLNLPFINKILIIYFLTKRLIQIKKMYKTERVAFICNTPCYYIEISMFFARLFASKRFSTTLIVPDLPIFVTRLRKSSVIKRGILKVLDKITMGIAQNFSNYILLTDSMKEFFPKKLNYIVMEGLIDYNIREEDETKTQSTESKIILYSGSLFREFGVMNLVEAFSKIHSDNVELWICGSGDSADDIVEESRKNPRIKYWGLLSPDEVLKKQRISTILVNPRTSSGEYTKYSFPSKTIEYLLSGRPVIAYHLKGIPQEYFNYIISPKDETISALSESLNHVLSMESKELDLIGKRGRDFVINFKNSQSQTLRIIQLINDTNVSI